MSYNITSVNYSQKTYNTFKKGTDKINRSDLSPSIEPFASFQPDLKAMKNENVFLKDYLDEYGISEESRETLQKIMQSTQTGGNFSLTLNFSHYLHSQFLLLKDSIGKDSLQDGVKQLKEALYLAFYTTSLSPILQSLESKDYDINYLMTPIDKIIDYHQKMIKDFYSDEYRNHKMQSLQRFKGDQQKRFEDIRDNIIKPLKEIGKTAQCIKELFSKLPQEKNFIFIDERADQNRRYVKEEFSNFKEILLSYFDIFENERTFPKKLYSEAFDIMIKLNEMKNLNKSAIIEQLFSLSYIVNKMDEALGLRDSSQHVIAENFMLRLSLDPFMSISLKEILENYDIRCAEIPLINLHVIFKKLHLFQEEKSLKMVSILTKNFSEELSVLSMSKDSSAKIQKCLDKINELVNTSIDVGLIGLIGEFIKLNQESLFKLGNLGQLKEKMNFLNKDIVVFDKLMKDCNLAFQKELDASTLPNDELKLLEQKILSYKTDISQILCPILTLPSVLDSIIICDKKTLISKKQPISNYQPILEDDIKLLFNVKFKKYAEKQDVIKSEDKKIEAPQEMNELIPTPTLDEPEITPKEPVIPSVKKQKVKAVKNESDRPKTRRSDIILAYLAEKGWVQDSIHGSHLKLKKENESLIIPIHKAKDGLAKGTLGAIYRQLDEKEEKIASRLL